MPDRILRDELLESDRWLGLPRNSHRLAFVCLIPKADPLGDMEAGDARLYRLWRDPLKLDRDHSTRAAVPEILEALVAADLVRLYEADGKRYLHIPRYRQQLRYTQRVFPLSPWASNEEKQRVMKNSPGDKPVITTCSPSEVKRSEVKRSEVTALPKTSLSRGRGAGGGESGAEKPQRRATQLPHDWKLPDAWRDWAVRAHHLDPAQIVRISLRFRDHWLSVPPAKAVHADWLATWRNWIRREVGDV